MLLPSCDFHMPILLWFQWKSLANHPLHGFLLKFILHQCMLVSNWLNAISYCHRESSFYLFCSFYLKTLDHIFILFQFSSQVWTSFNKDLDIHFVTLSNGYSFFSWFVLCHLLRIFSFNLQLFVLSSSKLCET